MIEIPDTDLLKAFSYLLCTVIQGSIQMYAEKPYEPSTEMLRPNNGIARTIDAAEIDKAAMQSKMTKHLSRNINCFAMSAVRHKGCKPSSTAHIIERLIRMVDEIHLQPDF